MPSWAAWAVVSRPHCPAAMWDARATTFVIILTLYHSSDTNGVMNLERKTVHADLVSTFHTKSVCDQDRSGVDALHHHAPPSGLRAHLLLFGISVPPVHYRCNPAGAVLVISDIWRWDGREILLPLVSMTARCASATNPEAPGTSSVISASPD